MHALIGNFKTIYGVLKLRSNILFSFLGSKIVPTKSFYKYVLNEQSYPPKGDILNYIINYKTS